MCVCVGMLCTSEIPIPASPIYSRTIQNMLCGIVYTVFIMNYLQSRRRRRRHFPDKLLLKRCKYAWNTKTNKCKLHCINSFDQLKFVSPLRECLRAKHLFGSMGQSVWFRNNQNFQLNWPKHWLQATTNEHNLLRNNDQMFIQTFDSSIL